MQNENETNQTDQGSESAADQAKDAPEVATSGAPAEPKIEDNEYEAEQREHLERRSEPELPDPNENAETQDGESAQE